MPELQKGARPDGFYAFIRDGERIVYDDTLNHERIVDHYGVGVRRQDGSILADDSGNFLFVEAMNRATVIGESPSVSTIINPKVARAQTKLKVAELTGYTTTST